MIYRPKIIHLLDDLSLGGVTKSLELFRHPALQRHYDFAVEEVHPDWSIAPKFKATAIVVHFSVSWKTLPFLYSLASRNPSAKLILMEHSYSEEWQNINVPDHRRFHTMLKLAHKIFDRVVCVSNAQAKWLEKVAALQAPKSQVIYPWSDMAGLFQLERPHFSRNAPLIIGTYGRFVDDKGFADLIAVFKSLEPQSKIQLQIGGFGPDEQKLKKLAAGNPNISFYGKVENVSDFLSQCDIVAVPSKFEAYGLVATEARLAARPILVAPVGGLPEQVGKAGVAINFGDTNAAAKLLIKLRSLPLVNMSVAGREDCLRATENRIHNWLALFDELHGVSADKAVA
ncbi:MAG: glycosyltransferase family 4 protein [Parasphingorhabdus sp.]|uniref:glycosyltransferase family 4 protein n=1 Tax=Parasphingorhabdus sp. TaxID=2709688 RepID=UPI00329716A7